jgi:hypothetical protein
MMSGPSAETLPANAGRAESPATVVVGKDEQIKSATTAKENANARVILSRLFPGPPPQMQCYGSLPRGRCFAITNFFGLFPTSRRERERPDNQSARYSHRALGGHRPSYLVDEDNIALFQSGSVPDVVRPGFNVFPNLGPLLEVLGFSWILVK